MRSVALSLILLSTPAFAGRLVPGATDTEALKGTVLVWHDAPLFLDASETPRSITLATLDDRAAHLGAVTAMKIVNAKGAMVEVEITGDDDCNWSHITIPDDIARVRFFVRRADLAPVLAKPFKKTWPDNTSITIAPGTPLAMTDAGTYLVAIGDGEIEVDIPAASVGHAYTPAKTGKVSFSGNTLGVTTKTAKLGDRTFAVNALKGSPVERRSDATVMDLEDRCVSAHVAVPNNALSDLDESEIEVDSQKGNASMMNLRDECFLPKLTPLSVGTHTVAVAAKPIYLHAEPTGKHACIQRELKLEGDREIKRTEDRLRICAPAESVAREVRRRARSAQAND